MQHEVDNNKHMRDPKRDVLFEASHGKPNIATARLERKSPLEINCYLAKIDLCCTNLPDNQQPQSLKVSSSHEDLL